MNHKRGETELYYQVICFLSQLCYPFNDSIQFLLSSLTKWTEERDYFSIKSELYLKQTTTENTH